MKSKNAPIWLVFMACVGAAVVAILDAHYREAFMQLTQSIVVGFWGYMQAPKE
ncbi:hypothetical protein DSM106972_016020 [Dulcicalothrix desertica PCC 7102]|uniref:Uncharacterized protein n=1 Tax=Dulcicalothrix desertica PCC 7102 TaxID=232991 RepID=A0A433VQQ6_9CYAN|nr:hypothetical protein [Dulcicalothrix desertica]RUT08434.1 hypothetical protein DSM106972_016020 [Dulcicalothrix desertica PCC 7102]TWH40299.1 hypothetical protein CAL7102_09606 [Dulcicalothrix desertica PCC 7102]